MSNTNQTGKPAGTNPLAKLAKTEEDVAGNETTQSSAGADSQSGASGSDSVQASTFTAADAATQTLATSDAVTDALASEARTTLDSTTVPASLGLVVAGGERSGADTGIAHGDEAAALLQAEQPQPESPQFSFVSTTQRLIIGRFEFENGRMNLDSRKDFEEFSELMAQQPKQIQNQVKMIDPDAANRMVAEHKRRMQTGIDTTAGTFSPSPTQQA